MKTDRMVLISSALLSAANTALTALFFSGMPARIPIHWNAGGTADGFAPRAAVWLFALMPLLVYAILVMTGAHERRKGVFSTEKRDRNMIGLILILAVEFGFMLTFLSVTGMPVDIGLVAVLGSGIVLIALGNILPRIRQNSFLGIRTVWTVSDETVWNATHRLGGYAFTICGAVLLLSVPAPASWRLAVIPAAVLLAVAVPIGYSFIRYLIEKS